MEKRSDRDRSIASQGSEKAAERTACFPPFFFGRVETMVFGNDFLRRRGVPLLAIMLGAVAASAQAPPPTTPPPAAPNVATSRGDIAAAQKLVQEGRLAEALKSLDTLAAQTPEPAGVEKLRGMALYQQRKLEDAAAAFGR